MCTQERILIANELNLLLCEHNTLCCHLEIEGKHSVSQVLVFKMRNDGKGTFPISKKQLEEALIAILLLRILFDEIGRFTCSLNKRGHFCGMFTFQQVFKYLEV